MGPKVRGSTIQQRVREDTHWGDGLKIIEAADKWERRRGAAALHDAGDAAGQSFFRAAEALARAVRRWRKTA
jgi:hypothetical protein